MKLKPFYLSLLWFFMASTAFAQKEDNDPIITDRPSFGTGVTIVPLGALQLETGFQFTSSNTIDPGNAALGVTSETFNFNNMLLRYGLFDRWELRLTQNLNQSRLRLDGSTLANSDVEFAPTTIGVKWSILRNQNKLPDLSLLMNIGDQLFSDTGAGSFIDATVLIGYTIFESFGLDINFGAVRSEGVSDMSYNYALGVSRSISDRIGFYIESYGILPADSQMREHNINGGFNFLLNKNTQLDLYGGTGFSRASPNVFLGFGFSKIFR